MKTLVITGAARQKGHTNQMVKLFLDTLGGDYDIIDAYRVENVAPCKDCRYCWHKKGCSIKDGMQEIYDKLEAADNIVLASPMYFHSITGKMKALIDRFQVYWAGHVRNDMPEKPVRVNMTFAPRVLRLIDRAAEEEGMTRSGFLAAAAKAYVRNQANA